MKPVIEVLLVFLTFIVLVRIFAFKKFSKKKLLNTQYKYDQQKSMKHVVFTQLVELER